MKSPLSLCVALSALSCFAPAPAATADVPSVDVWTQINPPNAPPAPFNGAIVENNAHGLVLISGAPNSPWDESVSRFDGETWTPVDDISYFPNEFPKATRFAATGDTGRARSWLFGGVVNGAFSNSTIAFTGDRFELLGDAKQSAPPARADAALAYFAAGDVAVLFGGVNENGLLGDTWLFNGETWGAFQGNAQPSPRANHAMAYDPINEVIILYGGTTANGPANDTWIFNGETWTQYALPGPSPRAGHVMFYDEGRERIVLVGGLPQDSGVDVAQTWEWTGTNWKLIDSQGPSPRIRAAAAYDSRRGLAVLFGGIDPQASLLNDTWELQLESPFDVVVETETGLRPTDVATGFFDGDEFPEAIVTDELGSSIFVFPNLGVVTGTPRGQSFWQGFGDPTQINTSGPPGKVETADLNNDGADDIIVGIPGGGGKEPGSEFFLGDGEGGFSDAITLSDDFGQDDIQPGDLDNVKDLGGIAAEFTDIAYVSTSSQLVGVIEGVQGGFGTPLVLESGGEPTRIAIGDINLDGLPDIVFTDRANGTVVVVPQRAGLLPRFDINDRIDFPVGLPGGEPVALVLIDFTGDGNLDVATADRVTNSVTALVNLGIGKPGWIGLFVTDISPTGDDPASIDAANFFGGSLPDLVTANTAGDTISVFRNLGLGLFADPIDITVNPGPVAAAVADLNADGLDDIVVASAPPAPPGILTSLLSAAAPPCPGDTDGDRFVGFLDLMNLLDVFGTLGAALPADFNADGAVDFHDLNQLLTNFGVTCP
ncbi:MAG: Kelch repeat-containing protein [Phycisphaerales bacterium]